jgi:nicotinate-nucleotide adenylyltransferase
MTSALVFGGSFDPVHNGHLAIAAQARDQSGADEVWFVPAAIAPMRDHLAAPPEERLALLRTAVLGMSQARVLDLAVRSGGISYTVDTMHALHHDHPATGLAVLLGADVARTIRAWHRSADLLAGERFVVVNRTGPPPLDLDELRAIGYHAERTMLLTVDSPNISASEIRSRCGRGKSIAGLVPEAVAAMIAATAMYRSKRDDA